jgi:hypothetical protein
MVEQVAHRVMERLQELDSEIGELRNAERATAKAIDTCPMHMIDRYEAKAIGLAERRRELEKRRDMLLASPFLVLAREREAVCPA